MTTTTIPSSCIFNLFLLLLNHFADHAMLLLTMQAFKIIFTHGPADRTMWASFLFLILVFQNN